MLIIVGAWALLYLMFVCFSEFFLKAMERLLMVEKPSFHSLEFLKLPLGMALFSFISSVWVLFYRINYEFFLVVLVLIFIAIGFNKKAFVISINKHIQAIMNLHVLSKVVLALLLFTICYISSDSSVYNLDPARYHIPNTLWIKEYGTVVGLANLKQWFGLSSSWYFFHAFFDFAQLEGLSYHFYNSLFTAYIFCFSIYYLDKFICRKEYNLVGLIVIFFGIFLAFNFNYISYFHLSCLSPDLPASILPMVIFVAVSELITKRELIFSNKLILLIIIALVVSFGISVKINLLIYLLPLFVSSLFVFSYRELHFKKMTIYFFGIISLIAVIISPFIIRNILLTGYVLYPLPLDLFAFDWELPTHKLMQYYDSPYGSFTEGNQDLDPGFMKSFKTIPWYRHLFTFYKNQLHTFGYVYWIIIALITAIVFIEMKARKYIVFYLLCFSTLFISIWKLPDFKYAMGIVGVFFAIGCSMVFLVFNERNFFFTRTYKSILAAIFLLLSIKMFISSQVVSISQNGIYYPLALIKGYAENRSVFYKLPKLPSPKYYVDEDYCLNSINVGIWDDTFYQYGRYDYKGNNYIDDYNLLLDSAGNKLISPEVAILLWETPLPSSSYIPDSVCQRGPLLKNGYYHISQQR